MTHCERLALAQADAAADAGPSIPQVGTGWHLDGAPNGGASAPRPLGADSDDVLHRWAGLAPAEIAGLRAAGVV